MFSKAVGDGVGSQTDQLKGREISFSLTLSLVPVLPIASTQVMRNKWEKEFLNIFL